MKVGREFWEFISGDARCLDELPELASKAADESLPGEVSFTQRVEMKLQELTNEFRARYGDVLSEGA